MDLEFDSSLRYKYMSILCYVCLHVAMSYSYTILQLIIDCVHCTWH